MGQLRSDVTCLSCGNVTTALDPMLDISLELKNIKKKISKVNSEADSENENYTLEECLDRFTSEENLGSRDYVCGKCGNTNQDATKQMSIHKLPMVVSFQLKVRHLIKFDELLLEV